MSTHPTSEEDERVVNNGSAHSPSDSHSTAGERHKDRHEEDEWDKQIKEDAKAGRLDELMEEARKAHREDNTKPLP